MAPHRHGLTIRMRSTRGLLSRAVPLRQRVNAVIDASALQAHAMAEALQAHLDRETKKLTAARAQSERVAAHAISLAFRLAAQKKVVDRRLAQLHTEHATSHANADAERRDALARAHASAQRGEEADAARAALAEEFERVRQSHAMVVAALQRQLADAQASAQREAHAAAAAESAAATATAAEEEAKATAATAIEEARAQARAAVAAEAAAATAAAAATTAAAEATAAAETAVAEARHARARLVEVEAREHELSRAHAAADAAADAAQTRVAHLSARLEATELRADATERRIEVVRHEHLEELRALEQRMAAEASAQMAAVREAHAGALAVRDAELALARQAGRTESRAQPHAYASRRVATVESPSSRRPSTQDPSSSRRRIESVATPTQKRRAARSAAKQVTPQREARASTKAVGGGARGCTSGAAHATGEIVGEDEAAGLARSPHRSAGKLTKDAHTLAMLTAELVATGFAKPSNPPPAHEGMDPVYSSPQPPVWPSPAFHPISHDQRSTPRLNTVPQAGSTSGSSGGGGAGATPAASLLSSSTPLSHAEAAQEARRRWTIDAVAALQRRADQAERDLAAFAPALPPAPPKWIDEIDEYLGAGSAHPEPHRSALTTPRPRQQHHTVDPAHSTGGRVHMASPTADWLESAAWVDRAMLAEAAKLVEMARLTALSIDGADSASERHLLEAQDAMERAEALLVPVDPSKRKTLPHYSVAIAERRRRHRSPGA